MGTEERAGPEPAPAVQTETFPADLRAPDVERWLTWKSTDGRKIPRAPYAHPDQPDRYVSAQDPEVWTDFETAREWATMLTGHSLAFVIRDRDAYPDEELVLVDYDDARDPDTGTVHPTVREHLTQAGSYADVSPSGTGVHILCRGQLPEDVKTIADALPAAEEFPDASIEVYDSARYVAMSGHHLEATPGETRECQAFLDDLADTYATRAAGTPDELLTEPETSTEELAAIESTDDMQVVFDAIAQTGPADIRLKSPVTEERSDGSTSRDPVWTTSASGTRLAEVDDGWIYREGMLGLDALQVVALEEGIVTDERTYPHDEDFWAAVEALRDRGAHVPRYEPSATNSSPASTATTGDPPDATDESVDRRGVGTASATSDGRAAPGDVDRALETKLLRERVAELEARIDELEAALARKTDRVETLEAERAELAEARSSRDQTAQPSATERTGSSDADETDAGPSSLWERTKRLFRLDSA